MAVIAVAVMVCGRRGFGRHSPPCSRHGLILGLSSFVAVIAMAVMVCSRHGFGRHSTPCGRHGLLLGPLSFVAVIAAYVAVMVCSRHGADPCLVLPISANTSKTAGLTI